jgi:4-hydroxybenzoyl-CoA thioesterase
MFTSEMTLTVAWGDCDPANIVYYPNYFSWFNEATGHHFLAAGLPKPELIRRYQVVGFPMLETTAKFHIPSSHGESVRIKTCIVRFGRSSFDVEHKLYRGDELAVEGFEKRVLVAQSEDGGIKSVPVPEAVIELFGQTA